MNKMFFVLAVLLSCQMLSAQTGKSDNGELAIIVAKKGEILSEEYYNGQEPNTLSNVQSLTKSIMSILIGIAVDQGIIANVQLKVSDLLLDEFSEIDNENKKSITIEHLLNQTSGLVWKGYLEHEEWLATEDPAGMVLRKDLVANPGEVYNYNSGATHLLSVILARVSQRSTLDFAQEFLFGPLGIVNVNWEKRGAYHDGGGLGLEMDARSLLKIGLMLQNGGRVGDLQIVSDEWVSKQFSVDHKMTTRWGLRKSTHGYCWYKSSYKGETVDYAMGYGGQFILLFPERGLTVIALHNHDTPDGLKQQIRFLSKRLPKMLKEN